MNDSKNFGLRMVRKYYLFAFKQITNIPYVLKSGRKYVFFTSFTYTRLVTTRLVCLGKERSKIEACMKILYRSNFLYCLDSMQRISHTFTRRESFCNYGLNTVVQGVTFLATAAFHQKMNG